MKTIMLPAFMLATLLPAYADFSYTITRKGSGAPATSKQYFKGQKMMTDGADEAIVIDFDSKTVTTIDKKNRSYAVVPFNQVGAGMPAASTQAKVDVKDTGQTKTIGGYNAHLVTMGIAVDSGGSGPMGPMQLQIDMEWWLSSDVPGSGEVKAFYQRNGDSFPWTSLTNAMGPAAETIAQGMRQVMKDGGVPLLQIVRSKMAGGPAMSAQQQAQLDQAKARLQAMAQAGGAQGAAAQQALQRMGGASSGGGSEQTMESSGFSTAGFSDSVFAVPGGFTKK